jgi:hypothetical protein
VLGLPTRKTDAIGGVAFAASIVNLPLQAREERIYQEVLNGNVPDFLRHLVAVPIKGVIDGKPVEAKIFVAPDYLAVGSDDDFLYVPMTPYTAQRIADRLHCTLPTPRMVDAIYAASTVKITPTPIPPGPAMTTVPEFLQINQLIHDQRQAGPLGALVAGDKKDIVICRALKDTPGHVAIYGWHKPDGTAIQPLYVGHFATWADYSHGVRLVSDAMELDGHRVRVDRVLKDPKLSSLLSGEGVIEQPRYVFHAFPHEPDLRIHTIIGEKIESFSPMPGVRVVIDSPTTLSENVRLVLYALPNGNSVENTIGRRMQPDDDWHFDIQHIGAQTRFVRRRLAGESLVVAYIEASNHSWPAWFKTHPHEQAKTIVEEIAGRFPSPSLRIVLDSHSGGGAFEFAYIESVERIPDNIDRIAFLDSEYAYDTTSHGEKLAQWLQGPDHYLCAIAYDDAAALYEGKPFVSASGGTWGRTHSMLEDLRKSFSVERANHSDPEQYVGLNGRITVWLKENPRHEIFHTVQVERNGFIESLLSGTPLQGSGYRYFGRRAYSGDIAP